jgi:hypothetical protein
VSPSSLTTPLATAAQFQKRFPQLCIDGPAADQTELEQIMLEATSTIEEECGRRFLFSGHIYSDRLFGIDSSDDFDIDMPLDLVGALGLSQAMAYGASNLVRNWWIDQTAPHYPELWTYSISSITLYLTTGSVLTVNPQTIEGPQPDTGHARFKPGTFAPDGTTIEVVYSGGYTVSVPPSLRRLCLYQAEKAVIMDNEPQTREGMNFSELENQIEKLMAFWGR